MSTHVALASGILCLWAIAWWFAKQFARQAPNPSRWVLPPPATGLWLAALAFWAAYSALNTTQYPRLPLLIGAGYLLVVALVDYWTGYIPDSAHLVTLVLAAGSQWWVGSLSLWALAAGAGMIMALLALWFIRRGGLGGGDIKLGGVLGFSLGLLTAASIFWLASLTALTAGLLLRRFNRSDRIRMGPHFLTAYTVLLSIPPAWLPAPLQTVMIP